MLSACVSGTQPTPGPMLIPPGRLMVLPDPPPPAPNGELETLKENHRESMRAYWTLRDRYQELIDWLEAKANELR